MLPPTKVSVFVKHAAFQALRLFKKQPVLIAIQVDIDASAT